MCLLRLKIEMTNEDKDTSKAMFFIYAYANKISGKMYIGRTEDLKRRDYDHENSPSKTMNIDKAIKKYGRGNFDLWTVEMVQGEDRMEQAEKYWIAEMRRMLGCHMVYNISDGGKAPMRGRHHSAESRAKISKANTGKKISKKAKKKLSIAAIGNKSNTGKIFDNEWRVNLSKSNAGQKRTSTRKFSEAEEKEICRKYVDEGKSTYALEKELEIYRSLVISILKRNDVKMRWSNYTGHSNGRNVFTLEQEKEICEEYEARNISRRDLARKYKCGATTIREVLLRHNVKL